MENFNLRPSLNRGEIVVLVVIAVIVMGGGLIFYWFLNRSSEITDELLQTPTPTVALELRTFPLRLNPQGNFGRPGTAILTEENGKAKILIGLGGTSSSVAQPVHIHVGSCSELGSVKYPLSNIVNSSSQTVLDLSMDELLNQRPLAINVHKSASEPDVNISCGDM